MSGSYFAWNGITTSASSTSIYDVQAAPFPKTSVGDLEESIIEKLRAIYEPAKAVIKCSHCGQWGARYCECVKCGAPIE